MSKILLFFICFLMTNEEIYKKQILPYEIVIPAADLIVEGKIVGVNGDFYDFEITETLKNNHKTQTAITVKMFRSWTCDWRKEPAEIGQALLLFLEKKDKVYDIINGSTGELFVEDIPRKFSSETSSFSYMEIKKGIQLFGASYELQGKLYESYKLKKITELDKIESHKKASTFFKFLEARLARYEVE